MPQLVRVRWFVFLMALMLVPAAAGAQSVRLAWDPSAEATGYVVRWGVSQGVYPNSADAGGATEVDIAGLTPGASYWAVVQAYDGTGTYSLPSYPLNFVAPSAACSYSITPASISIASGAADGTMYVTTQAGCAWSATSTSGFITFSDGASRVGPGAVGFTVAANTLTTSRTGTATVGGQTFSVTQAGEVPCTYSITPSSVSLGNVGDSGTIYVTTGPTCAWAATSNVNFITFADGTERVGSGGVTFTVATNYANTVRTGAATVATTTFSLAQAAAPIDTAARQRENARSDFDGDGKADLLWQDVTGGNLALWKLDGLTILGSEALAYRVQDNDWRIVGTGDFNNDGKADIIWQHRTEGWVYVWYMDGRTRIGDTYLSLPRMPSAGWRVAGIGDFNSDGRPDLVWQHTSERWLSVWLVNGVSVTNVPLSPNRVLDSRWQIAGTGDFNADGQTDLLWRDRLSGELGAWLMNGLTRLEFAPLNPGRVLDQDWDVASVSDVNRDGTPDIIWQHATQGWSAVWYMNGVLRSDVGSFATTLSLNWKIAAPK